MYICQREGTLKADMHDFLTRGIPNFNFYGVLILLGTKGIGGTTEKSNFVSDVQINYLRKVKMFTCVWLGISISYENRKSWSEVHCLQCDFNIKTRDHVLRNDDCLCHINKYHNVCVTIFATGLYHTNFIYVIKILNSPSKIKTKDSYWPHNLILLQKQISLCLRFKDVY